MHMDDERTKPATKGDIQDLEVKILDLEVKILDQVDGKLQQHEDRLREAIRDSQTEVLRAFYSFSRTIQARFLELDQTDANVKRRMDALESRILDVEKRLNMPPNAA
jgi:hypothetical protein